MVLEILKNNYERKGENYYSKKIRNNSNKYKKKKKKSLLEEDSEKDNRNIESGINEESYNVYELYENMSNKNKKNMNSSFIKLNKNGSITKNKIRELYSNSKENLQYGTNENDIFTEDIYENDNFDDDNFVEDDNIEYKTYNSYANPESKLFNNYSSVNLKKIIDSDKKYNKKRKELYNKYNYPKNYDKKNIKNKYDLDIIKTLNDKKKNVEYEKHNGNYHKRSISRRYSENAKYKPENYKNYNDDDNEEENNNYEYYDDADENYYEYGENDADADDEEDDEEEDVDDEEGADEDDEDGEDDTHYNEDNRVIKEKDKFGNGDKIKKKNEGNLEKDYAEIEEEEESEEEEMEDENEDEDKLGEEEEESEEDYDGIKERERYDNETKERENEEKGKKKERKREKYFEDYNNKSSNEYKKVYQNDIKNVYESKFKIKNEIKENFETLKKREDDYFEKEIISYNKEEIKEFAPYKILNDKINNKNSNNFEIKAINYKKEYNWDNLKNKEKKKNQEAMEICINESNYKKDDLIGDMLLKIKNSGIDNKKNNSSLIFNDESNKYNINKNLNKILNTNNQIVMYHNTDNGSNKKSECKQKEIVNVYEHVYSISDKNTVERSSDLLNKKENFKELKFNGEIIREINTEDKKKNNIKMFIDKMKNKKNCDEISKREDKKYEYSQKKDKKEKIKMKFTDILYAGALGQFFHRSKNNFVNSSSPQLKDDNDFEEFNNINNLEKFNFNDDKLYNVKDAYSEKISIHKSKKDERKYCDKIELGIKIDNKSNHKMHGEKKMSICYNQINEKSNNLKDDKMHNKLINEKEKTNILRFSNVLNDKNIESSNKCHEKNKNLYPDDVNDSKYSYINDINEKKNALKHFNSVRNYIINQNYYKNKYDKNFDTKNVKIDGKENKGTLYAQSSYNNSFGSEKRTGSSQNTKKKEKKKDKIKTKEQKIEDKKQKELEVKMDQNLNRRMIENNELKKYDEIDEELIVTPFYIKSKIDKVLKNSEIFERSARATFQQFDIKNKNFLHFSEIESLIQKLCYNLELPPVDKNILSIVYKDYDSSKNNSMNYTDFRQMYWDLLKQIKKKYYPTKNFKIKRNCIVSRKKLCGYDYSSIYNYLSFKKIIGSGAFGEVHLVEDNICKLYKVVKILKKKNMKNIKINEEINVLIYLDHPNIIKIFDVYENVDCTYIVMELCEGGELMNKIKNAEKFNEKNIKNIMFQILCAIAYMHSHNIAHKDLKPENILFKAKDDDTLKIIDFGLAELINKSEGVSKTAAGTVLYMAPEVFKKNFTIKCDIWSAGVIMFFLFAKSLPFYGNTYEEVKQSIFKDEPDYRSLKPKLSQSALHILKLMLEKDHNKRPMAALLLHHPWFQGYLDPIEISPGTLDNIKSYMKHSNIRNIIINIMAHELSIINRYIKYINEIFCKIDTNHNGSLSHREIYTVLSSAGIKKWDINRIVQALDINDRGSITYTEFIAGCYKWKNIESTFLKAAFNKIDKDEDGYISKGDIVTLVRDKDIDSNDIDNFFSSAYSIKKDVPKDKKINKISFEDFKEYMLSTF